MARRPPQDATKRLVKRLGMVLLWIYCLALLFCGYVINEALRTQFQFSEHLMLSIASTEPPNLRGETVLGTGCEALRDTRYMRVFLDMKIPETTRNIENPVFATSVIVTLHIDSDHSSSQNVSKQIVVKGEKLNAVSFKPGLEKTVRAFIMWLPRVLRLVDDFERIQYLAVDAVIPSTASAMAVLPSCKAATVEVNVQALSELVMHVAGVHVTSSVWKYNLVYRALHRIRFFRFILINTIVCVCVAALAKAAIFLACLAICMFQKASSHVSYELSLLAEAIRTP